MHYTVVGPDDGFKAYVSDLRRLIARHADRVNVEIARLASGRGARTPDGAADVFVNLRHPVMEGSSASLMRQLAYGRPILCFDSGFFAELPEGAVDAGAHGRLRRRRRGAARARVGSPDRRRRAGRESACARGVLQRAQLR